MPGHAQASLGMPRHAQASFGLGVPGHAWACPGIPGLGVPGHAQACPEAAGLIIIRHHQTGELQWRSVSDGPAQKVLPGFEPGTSSLQDLCVRPSD